MRTVGTMTKQAAHGASETLDLIRSRHGKPEAVSVLPLATTDALERVKRVASLLTGRLKRELRRQASDEKPCIPVWCFDSFGRPYDGRVLTAQTFLDHVADKGLVTALVAGNGFGFLLGQYRGARVFPKAAAHALGSVIVQHPSSVARLSEGM